jgi:alpha/beta hydrolase family protein
MSQRVLASDRALHVAAEFRALLAGDLRDRLRTLDLQGRTLSRPEVWEGPDAARFRAALWPAASGTITRALAQLDRLADQAEHVTRDIVAAGGDGGFGPAHLAIGAGDPAITGDLPLPPSPGTQVQDVHNWWTNLTWDQQQAEINTNPGQIGRLNGIPADARDRANRMVLNEKIEALETSGSQSGDLEHLRYLASQLDSYDHANPNDPDNPRRYLLNFDDQHLDDHVVVAIGNPDYSDNVVTMVPGGTQLKDLSNNIPWARNVLHASRQADSSQTTSVITWMDYHSGSQGSSGGLGAIGDTHDAIAAGRPLNDFEQGLRQTHEQRPYGLPLHTVLIGHSYGTLVLGESSQQPDYRPPDDMIMTGGPGMGVAKLPDLHLPQPDGRSHLWVGDSSGDPATKASDSGVPLGLGGDPALQKGAFDFTTDSHGHDDYYTNPNSTDMKNIGDIVVGNYDGVQGHVVPFNPTDIPA